MAEVYNTNKYKPFSRREPQVQPRSWICSWGPGASMSPAGRGMGQEVRSQTGVQTEAPRLTSDVTWLDTRMALYWGLDV